MAKRKSRAKLLPAPKRTSARDEASRRVRHLLVLDARTLVGRLVSRSDEMVRLFSRLRDRTPLLAATHTLWPSIGFDSLACLSVGEQRAALAFFELAQELRWYLSYTEDMPTQLRANVAGYVERLQLALGVLTAVLGPLDAEGARIVDAEPPTRVAS
jgi:hypothetical protein